MYLCMQDPEFNWKQMEEIRLGLMLGLDVSVYAKPKFSSKKMRKIRKEMIRRTG